MKYALLVGLELLRAEGLQAPWERRRANAQLLWQGLQALGLELVGAPENRLLPLTTVQFPAGVNDLKVRQSLLNERQIEIAGGLGPLTGKAFRIGHLGDSNPATILGCLGALEAAMLVQGIAFGRDGLRRAVDHLAADDAEQVSGSAKS